MEGGVGFAGCCGKGAGGVSTSHNLTNIYLYQDVELRPPSVECVGSQLTGRDRSLLGCG